MAKFYHVSGGSLLPGTVLRPGRWGETIQNLSNQAEKHGLSAGSNLVIMQWELALETARHILLPHAPSRFDCVFASAALGDAIQFRDKYRAGWLVYEVECRDDAPLHNGDFDLISVARPGFRVREMAELSRQYWTGIPAGLKEVLIGAPVTVVQAAV